MRDENDCFGRAVEERRRHFEQKSHSGIRRSREYDKKGQDENGQEWTVGGVAGSGDRGLREILGLKN